MTIGNKYLTPSSIPAFKLNEIKDVIGICLKNTQKLNSREVNRELELLFDTLLSEKIYPTKQNNKVSWKK